MNLVLQRVRSTDTATFGHLLSDQGMLGLVASVSLCTVEKPWRDNQPEISCVPAGTYPIVRRWSPHFSLELFEMENVPGRSACEIHPGNTADDVRGCIAVGLTFGSIDGVAGVLESRVAFGKLMDAMQGIDRATLTIRDPVPVAA